MTVTDGDLNEVATSPELKTTAVANHKTTAAGRALLVAGHRAERRRRRYFANAACTAGEVQGYRSRDLENVAAG